MIPLEVHLKEKVLHIAYTTKDKPFGGKEITLLGKNGVSIYIFRKEMGFWKLTYGELSEDLREACIDAIILRFDQAVAEICYHEGMRLVVEIRPKPKRLWHVFINDAYAASIRHDGRNWEFHFDEQSFLDNNRMTKYVGMIAMGKIRWIDRDGRG
ncbi:hypothetical protein [Sphingobacterium paludis]|uniref:Uncharacterized protein n=1 Tax=Sphingobacterium paludis TaxID=1476465 RepID=A0A4R7CV81_9SPHI|nr:hypothetical protein [Sphingobacterium paludis]TDS11757.1 hypothetical protein B0I21_107100 [Sphingobacterium paludis]